MCTFIFGHKNPDTDSVASTITFSYLKNQLGKSTIPCVLGNINKESEYVLNYFHQPTPTLIENVKTQVKDLNYDKIATISPDSSILSAYQLMGNSNQRMLPVVDENNKLLGIITMKDIAMGLIQGDFYHLHTSLSNIIDALNGKLLTGKNKIVKGNISVIAFYYKTIKDSLNEEKIIIVGDRYDIIEHAIHSDVKLIIVTGNKEVPNHYLNLAREKDISIISVPIDTYTTSKLINQCNYISSIMKKSGIIKFHEYEYLEDVKEEIINTNHINYPIVDDQNTFLGFINRKHILKPGRKKVILVDHNEYSQSAEGLNEADVLEIIDHHKLGDICTTSPINFRNMPVGSTCTIIHQIFKEQNIDIPYNMAGILLSGILSDTLFFRSPTTTNLDKQSIAELNVILNLDIEKFAMEMFKAGTSLEGQSIEEIFYKDFKEFVLEGQKAGIGQVFTLDIEDVLNRKEEFIDFIDKVHHNKDYFLTLLLITDLLKEGSYLLFKCNHHTFMASTFGVSSKQGVFAKNILSRKKQVVPKISEALSMIK
ncbi:putative manganese-dependent inorganic diphosphatase [Crassaminicella profunda]|uniref:putative manganese-dependent inorganic diphosphatase n=1 Tax=Crassaminicella profunda TaxID=1286698 RepID=UPI001CA6178F|nr:putative manganese-dependent inorganic diphosphatase [Crassaminicella profunda]QZY56196.1 putative manganese-dependent inorganic diphosphatase [Crassaminicella profunda]